MHLIICDDDPVQVEQLVQLLAKRPGYEIAAFYSGSELLKNLPPYCDIAILDVKLQDALGTTLTKKLKEVYPTVDVILISAFPQYVTAAFHVRASQFLMKPLSEQSFLQEFDHILADRASQHFRWIVSNKSSVYALLPKEILFIEAYHRHLFIHTETGDDPIDIFGKLQDAHRTLAAYGFALCHQGFLINLRHIRQITANNLICTGGHTVPISGRKRKAFLEQYAQFIAR